MNDDNKTDGGLHGNPPFDPNVRRCEHCGGTEIIDRCAFCGAPQCCRSCCAETCAEAKSQMAAKSDDVLAELEALKAENERLKDCLRRCKSDWTRLKDWCIGGQGLKEMFRLQDAAKDAKSNADVFIRYITSLWDELGKSK